MSNWLNGSDVFEIGASLVRLVDGDGKDPLYQASAAVALYGIVWLGCGNLPLQLPTKEDVGYLLLCHMVWPL